MINNTISPTRYRQMIGDTRKWQGWRVLAYRILLGGLVAMTAGCPQPIAYQPQTGLVASLGPQETEQRLKDVLLRAVNPRIDAVELNEKFLRYHVAGTAVEIAVSFKDVQRLQVFNNHWVFLWKDQKYALARILFADQQDAMRFADLFMSFQSYYTT